MTTNNHLDLLDGYELETNFAFPPFAGVGQALRDSLHIYKENFTLVAKIVFASYLPMTLAQNYLPVIAASPWLALALNVVSALLLSLLEGALVFGIAARLRTGDDPPLGTCFRWGVKKWGAIFGASFLAGALTTLGFILLIVPGIILFTMFSLAVPAAALENVGAREALSRSVELTKGRRMEVFGTLFLFWLINVGISWLVMGSFAVSEAGALWASVMVALTTSLLKAMSSILALTIYLGLQPGRQLHGHPAVNLSAFGDQAR